jgi:hypothetical protein
VLAFCASSEFIYSLEVQYYEYCRYATNTMPLRASTKVTYTPCEGKLQAEILVKYRVRSGASRCSYLRVSIVIELEAFSSTRAADQFATGAR